jgi:hypothetical protein
LLLGGTGCVTTRAFVPGEHVTGLSPGGDHYAAEYTVRDADHLIAEIKVWALGASRDGSGDAVTTVYLGFEVDNVGASPVRLDPKRLFLDDVRIDDGEQKLARIRPLGIEGDTLIPPGEERTIEVSFALPDDVWPSDVRGYRVAWQLTNGGSYSQKTPFLRAANLRRGDPYPYYGTSLGFYMYGAYPYGAWPSWRYRRYYPGWPYAPYYYR